MRYVISFSTFSKSDENHVRMKVTIAARITKFNANGKIQLAQGNLKRNSIYQFQNEEVKDGKFHSPRKKLKRPLNSRLRAAALDGK